MAIPKAGEETCAADLNNPEHEGITLTPWVQTPARSGELGATFYLIQRRTRPVPLDGHAQSWRAFVHWHDLLG